MKLRFSVNYIFVLINDVGVRFIKNREIIEEVVGFYEGVMGLVVSLKFGVNINILREGVIFDYG